MPWNTPVFTSYDSKLNFYWGSDQSNQHSKNILKNPNVFCNIYDSRAAEGTGEGLYLEGKVRILEDINDINIGLNSLLKRSSHFGDNASHYTHEKPRRIYKFTPEKIWINDGATKDGDYVDIRKKIDLEDLKEKLN